MSVRLQALAVGALLALSAAPAPVAAAAAPTIDSVNPTSGRLAGGTTVTISGANFQSGAIVTFGGTMGANVTVVSATEITVVTPSHAAGAVDVVVTNVDQQDATFVDGFTFTDSGSGASSNRWPGLAPDGPAANTSTSGCGTDATGLSLLALAPLLAVRRRRSSRQAR